jgi:hypothetical protein
MDRFFTLLDNVTYMKHEHIQKEKEYGIPWRSAFKVELHEISQALHARTMSESEAEEMDEDPFVVMHKIVRQDSVDAATFDSRCQADLLFMLVNQLEFLEIGVYTIKKMLKESDLTLFNDIKKLVRGALKKTHLEFNPQSDNYKEDDLNEKAEREAAKKIRLDALRKNSKIKKGVKKSDLEAVYRELFDIMDTSEDKILQPNEFKNFMQVNYELHGITHETSGDNDHKI